jgi:hypothetical protein
MTLADVLLSAVVLIEEADGRLTVEYPIVGPGPRLLRQYLSSVGGTNVGEYVNGFGNLVVETSLLHSLDDG